MGFNTFPCNPYPISTEELNKGNNDDINTRVSTLESEVSDLNSTKANQITIAPFFSAESSYSVGDLVYYNGLTYRCTNDHEGDWDADDFAATTIASELDTLKSGLTDVSSKVTRIDNAPLYVTKTSDITLGSGASGTVSFTKSDFTIPSGYTADWSTCIYSVVGGWGIGCNSQAAFNSGEPHFTDSNSLLVYVTSNTSSGNVAFRVAVSVKIIANQ